MIRTILLVNLLLVVLCGLGRAQEIASPPSAQNPTDEKQAEPASTASTGAALAGVAPTEAAPVEELTDVQEVHPESAWESSNYQRIDRVVNLLTTTPTRKHALLFTIDHRPFEAAFTKNFFRDWFGFDSDSLKIGIGLRFGILEDLDIGLFRLNQTVEKFDVYQLDARYRFLKQDRMLVNMAIRAGLTWFYRADARSTFGGFGQLMIDRVFWDMLELGASLLYHSSSTGYQKNANDTDYSLALGVYFQFRPFAFLVWSTELSVAVAGYAEAHPIISTALKFVTYRHTFSLVVTNSQYISADGIVANTYRGAKDLILGFTITREFDF